MLWKEKYRLGVPMIDFQHQELFGRVNDFVETVRKPVSWQEKEAQVAETLDFMKDYVITHFRDEEAYQTKIGYPALDKHKKIHSEMVAYVADVAKQFETQPDKEVLMRQFAGKLLAWLINHVASEDQKIANFAKGGGSKSNV